MQQLRFSDIISSLSDPVIDEIFLAAAPHIKAISQELNVNYKYISIQARLLIPFYSKQEIQNSGSQCIKTILKQLHKPIISFNQNYQLYSKETGICTLPSELCLKFSYNQLLLENSSEVIPINFEKVQSDIGIAIQENLHYIHSARSDTKFHLGIFLPEKRVPLCYASFSICDRKYLAKALGSFLNLDIETHEIIVMTRAFSFISYKNMMSKLFDLSAKNLKNLVTIVLS
jgi:hypothetical protein